MPSAKKIVDRTTFPTAKKSREGTPLYPIYRTKAPTYRQLNTIKTVAEEFRAEGGNPFYVDAEDEWKVSFYRAQQIINRLLWDKAHYEKAHGLRPGVWKYVNLCKENETGKRIHYITKRKYGCPKGYSFIGQIGTRFYPNSEVE